MGPTGDARALGRSERAGLPGASVDEAARVAAIAPPPAVQDGGPVRGPLPTPPIEPLPRRVVPHVGAWIAAAVAVGVYVVREEPQFAFHAGAAFVFTWALLLWLVPSLHRWDVLDRPGGRALHRQPVPRLGGVAVYIPFAIAVFSLSIALEPKLAGLLVGATLMVVVGLIDDVRGASPRLKIGFQLAAGVALVVAGFRLPALGVPGLGILELGWLEIPAILFLVVLVSNAFNLVDGMDGLATGLALVALGGLFALGIHPLVVLTLAGALWGFLPYNLPRARIFLGDTGSLFVGFVLAALVLELPTHRNMPLMVALLAYPLGDVALASLRRFVRGKPLFTPDQSHIHHKLRYHFREQDVLAVMTVVVLAAIATGLGLGRPGIRFLVLMAVLWGLMAVLLVYLGRTGLGLMFKTRKPFRELHLLRVYLLGRLDLARSEEEIGENLLRLSRDLPLVSLDVGDFHWRSPHPVRGAVAQESLQLTEEMATWTLETQPGEQYALSAERRTVVSDVLRRVEQRWRAYGAKNEPDALS